MISPLMAAACLGPFRHDAFGVVTELDQVKRCAQVIAQHTYRLGEALSAADTKLLCKKPL